MPLIPILISLLVLALIYWAVTRILSVLGTPPQILVIVNVIFVVIVVLWLLQILGFLGSTVPIHLR